jgi:hypothetical protein
MVNGLRLIAFAGAFTFGKSAHAHMISTGVGPFYDGFTHVFVTPADLIAALGLAILGGVGGPLRGRAVLFAMVAGWSAGILGGAVLLESEWRPLILFPALIVPVGLAIAADRDLPRIPLAVATFIVALLFGYSAGSGIQSVNYPIPIGAGMIAGLVIAASLVTALAVPRSNPRQRIALRVAGSWIAAIGLLAMAGDLQKL